MWQSFHEKWNSWIGRTLKGTINVFQLNSWVLYSLLGCLSKSLTGKHNTQTNLAVQSTTHGHRSIMDNQCLSMLHAVKASPWLNSILIETRKAKSRRAVLGPYSFGCLPGTLLRGITCLISWWRLFRLLFLASPNTSSLVSSISLPWWTHRDLSASRLLTAAREVLILVFWRDQGGYVLRLYPKA